MAEPFKNLLGAELVRDAASHLARVLPRFDAKRFMRQACDGLEALELKARALHICSALESTLPSDFLVAADALEAALAPPLPLDAPVEPSATGNGLSGWILWPVGEFVARHGQTHPERALRVLHALTQRFTAEFAIRPFIVRHPALVFATLQRWVLDESAHVRRLVSEGTRPRLPWGTRLKGLVDDPSPTLPLLRALQDDPSASVRRSVANHLNDISRDHPEIVTQWLRTHLVDAPTQRLALLRHASRSLIKSGHPEALEVWGVGRAFDGKATLQTAPARATLGGTLTMALRLQSTCRQPQKLLIDYVVHHVKAHGGTTPKVFKGWQVTLPPLGVATLTRRHSLRPVTTRRYHAGRHGVVVQINGQAVATSSFSLETHDPSSP